MTSFIRPRLYRWSSRVITAVGLILGFTASNPASAAPPLSEAQIQARLPPVLQGQIDFHKYTPEDIQRMNAPGPNPMLSLPAPGARVDRAYWRMRGRLEAQQRAVRRGRGRFSNVNEREPNDEARRANRLFRFGTRPGQLKTIDVTGALTVALPTALVANLEDEGAIGLATPTGLSAGTAVMTSGAIGDGLYGSAGTGSGDFDFYAFTGIKAGQTIFIDVNTPEPFGDLDTYIILYDSAGEIVAFDDDGSGDSFDSQLVWVAPADGDYYLSVGGFGSFFLDDPFDPTSGIGFGSEGTYDLFMSLDNFDDDYFSFRLSPGGVFSARLDGVGGKISLLDRNEAEKVGSSSDTSFIYPESSPLLGGGTAVLAYVIDQRGRYFLRVRGFTPGSYTLTVQADTNPLLREPRGAVQTLFIDFDGATLDDGRTLSPLSSFLAGWGLASGDEDAVIDAIMASVTESISDDVRARGNNGDFDTVPRPGSFDIEILNSRDHADPFGQPNVSRVIVGGTIAELGIPTIGIAESIDVGNFAREETAFMLLDLLSAPADESFVSLNGVPRAPGVSIIPLIGAAVGNITAHEAGHYFGNFHTEQFESPPNIMDQGGNLLGTIGVGDDGIFGTADDIDVDFGPDIYVPNEGFTGVEDTLNTLSFGLPTPWLRPW